MSINKKTGKYHQTKGKKYSVNLDDESQRSFLFIKQTLEIHSKTPATNTDIFKWLIDMGFSYIEKETERASKLHQ